MKCPPVPEWVVRYDINNHGYGTLTCDPAMYVVTFSDGTSSTATPEVGGSFIIQSGASASGSTAGEQQFSWDKTSWDCYMKMRASI